MLQDGKLMLDLAYVMKFNFRIVKAFRILIGKGIVNDYWIVWVHVIVCLGYNMATG